MGPFLFLEGKDMPLKHSSIRQICDPEAIFAGKN